MSTEEQLPKLHKWLFNWFSRPELNEELEGDLLEWFEEDKEVYGLKVARKNYKREVLKMIRPSVLRHFRIFKGINTIDMFRNYLKLSFRNLWRDKEHSLISIFGLATGIVASVLIFQYANFELSYDLMHDQSDGRVYRVSRISEDMATGETDSRSSHHYLGIQSTITNDLPEVSSATHLFQINGVFTYNGSGHNADNVYCTTGSFFDVFDFQLLKGEKADLDNPGAVFLSESLAKRIFGDEDPMEKLIRYNDTNSNITQEVQVKGVYRDLPANSHLSTPAMLPSKVVIDFGDQNWFPTLSRDQLSWRWAGYHTYIKALPGTDPNLLSDKVIGFVKKYREPYNQAQGRIQSVTLHPLEKVHFAGDYGDALSPTGDRKIVRLFMAIGVLIVLIAWTNFVNLASARAVKRAREVGVRKTMGAVRPQLIQQFLLEALLINFLALVVAAGLVVLVIPQFHQLIGFPAFDHFREFLPFWAIYLLIYFMGSLLTGFYPAMVLTRFEPIKVLRGNFKTSSQGILLRKSLMFAQFAIVLVMLSGILSIRAQIKFMMDFDNGMNTEQSLIIEAPPAYLRDSTYAQKIEAFQGQVLNNTAIVTNARSSIVPGVRNQFFQTVNRSDRPSSESVLLYMSFIDEDFLDFYGLKLLSGRGFDKAMAGDRDVVLINEEALKRYDFDSPQDAIGKRLSMAGGQRPRIVGVVEDFNPMGVKFAIEPLAMQLDTTGNAPFINVRLRSGNIPEAVSYLEKTYQDFFPAAPFESFFVDEGFRQVYEADQRLNSILKFFAVVAVFISCLGIFGLSSFLINQKMKEVSIRKVLGAGTSEVMRVLTKEYIQLVLISALVATPVAYWLTQNWLDTFLQRIAINPLFFVLPVAGLVLVLFITIGNKTWKAIRVNPARTLKDE